MSDLDTDLIAKAEHDLILAFRSHWRRLVIEYLDGRNPADERCKAFLAGSPGARRALADWFYGY
jgi:hypothetical protein